MLHNAQNVSEVLHGVLYPKVHTWVHVNQFQKKKATMQHTITISSNYCPSGKQNWVRVWNVRMSRYQIFWASLGMLVLVHLREWLGREKGWELCYHLCSTWERSVWMWLMISSFEWSHERCLVYDCWLVRQQILKCTTLHSGHGRRGLWLQVNLFS